MWYFTWILGVLLACSLGIINVLRLEAQEALAKDNIALDPLTRLLNRDSLLVRLREKVENSRRNGKPFALVYISLRQFKIKQVLLPHEMDATLLRLVETVKQEIRSGVDIISRIGADEILTVLPGVPQARAEEIAEKIQHKISTCVKTPGFTAVQANISAVEYLEHANAFKRDGLNTMQEAEKLLTIAAERCLTGVAA